MQPKIEDVVVWAKNAGQILRDGFGKEHDVHYKSEIDIVTEIDKKSEDYLIGEIRKYFPTHTIIGEESGKINGSESDGFWFIDPLDGTSNYAHGLPIFSVSIGYQYAGEMQLGVVYDPMMDECFTAVRGQGAYLDGEVIKVSDTTEMIKAMLVTGFPYDVHNSENNNLDYFASFIKNAQAVRRLGSAAIDLCYVASGRLDGYWELSLQAWDAAAGVLILEEAGGISTKLDGTPFELKPPHAMVAANPTLHAKMMDIVLATKNGKH